MPSPEVVFNVDVNVTVHIHQGSNDSQKLDEILRRLSTIQDTEALIMADLTALTAQVQANTDAEASAVTLINGIAAQLAAAATDPAKVTALASQLKSSADALAAAVVANTPAAPAGP